MKNGTGSHAFLCTPTIDYVTSMDSGLRVDELPGHTNKLQGEIVARANEIVFVAASGMSHVLSETYQSNGGDPYEELATKISIGGNGVNAFMSFAQWVHAYGEHGVDIPTKAATLVTADSSVVCELIGVLQKSGIDDVIRVLCTKALTPRRSLHVPKNGKVYMLGTPTQPLADFQKAAEEVVPEEGVGRLIVPGAFSNDFKGASKAVLPSTSFVSTLSEFPGATPLAKYTEMPWHDGSTELPSVLESDGKFDHLNTVLARVIDGKKPQPYPLAVIGTKCGTIMMVSSGERVFCLENGEPGDASQYLESLTSRFPEGRISGTGRGDAIVGAAENFPHCHALMQKEGFEGDEAVLAGLLLCHYSLRCASGFAARVPDSNIGGLEPELFVDAIYSFVPRVRKDMAAVSVRPNEICRVRSGVEGRAALWLHPKTLEV